MRFKNFPFVGRSPQVDSTKKDHLSFDGFERPQIKTWRRQFTSRTRSRGAAFPLTSSEIKEFELSRLLNHGGLPEIYDGSEPDEDLASYVDTYLKEEIKAEAATRNVAAFAEFLDVIALSNGQENNYHGFASDLQVSTSTFKNYLQILEDTLIGFRLPGFTDTRKRKGISRAKHFLFDLGVTRHLAKTGPIEPKSGAFGEAFEHFIVLEIRAYLSYSRSNLKMCYWRSTSRDVLNQRHKSSSARLGCAPNLSSAPLKFGVRQAATKFAG